jgi:hypothetical protein
MRSDVFDGVVLAIEVEYGDLLVVQIYNLPLAYHELFGPRYLPLPIHSFQSFITNFRFGAHAGD